MLRFSIAALTVAGVFTLALAQDGALPEAPKPPKSKSSAVQEGADPKAAGESVNPGSANPGSGSSASGGSQGGRLRDLIGGGDMPRPRRVRINVPYFQMDVDLSRGRGGSPSVSAGASAPARNEKSADKSDDWRYRWHEGRWWYWMPSERWVYWNDGGWVDPSQPGKRIAASGERPSSVSGLPGLNLQDLMKSGEIRIGEPRRGNVDLEFDGIPPVRFGF